jgi:hypothetical protein
MRTTAPDLLSDRELLDETARIVDRERRTTAGLLALLAELDARRLYLGEGYSSLFVYCTHALHLSEPAAYSRITAARAARRFPVILALLADGAVTLTTISLLAAHLTDENHEALLEAARHKSKREIERLVAALDPQPDMPASVRKLPVRGDAGGRPAPDKAAAMAACGATSMLIGAPLELRPVASPTSGRPLVAPLSPTRYLIKVTVCDGTHHKFERARALLRHVIPKGDPAEILDRALTLLVADLERTRLAATPRPRAIRPAAPNPSRSRHVRAAVKRAVWARDGGQCAFIGPRGRCAETGLLELHHRVPYADGGTTSVDNLQLRCRSHNVFEAARWSGESAY